MHKPNQFDLLRQRRFAPFFWTQFLAAANDNVFKNAFVVFVAFAAASLTAIDAGMIVNLIGAVFIVPFMLFSATAGQLADKYEKSALIRLIKLFEIAIMVIALVGFWRRSVILLFVALALLGVHSTLFGPVKYAILPQTLKTEELVGKAKQASPETASAAATGMSTKARQNPVPTAAAGAFAFGFLAGWLLRR